MVSGAATKGIYDAALTRRQALMGKSGPAALVKNFKVFSIAMFACIGGLLYGTVAETYSHSKLTFDRV
jgi:hypothetical protein